MPPLLLGCLLVVSIVGCAQTTFTSESEPASLESSVTPADQTEAEKKVKTFVAQVQIGEDGYPAIRQMMSPALQAKAPATLAQWLKKGNYQSISHSTDWQIDQSRYMARGKKLLVYTHFTGADHSPHQTNYTFVKAADGDWQLDQLLPPSTPRKPTAELTGFSKLPK